MGKQLQQNCNKSGRGQNSYRGFDHIPPSARRRKSRVAVHGWWRRKRQAGKCSAVDTPGMHMLIDCMHDAPIIAAPDRRARQEHTVRINLVIESTVRSSGFAWAFGRRMGAKRNLCQAPTADRSRRLVAALQAHYLSPVCLWRVCSPVTRKWQQLFSSRPQEKKGAARVLLPYTKRQSPSRSSAVKVHVQRQSSQR